MHSTETGIDIDVPVEVIYNDWARLENLPNLLSVVDSIETGEGDTSHWKLSFGPVTREFDAEITEKIPQKRIAWKSISGPEHAGVITFHHLSDTSSRLGVQIDFQPDGVAETVASALKLVESAIEYDLGAFKRQVEDRHPTA